jgi:hypothetical protein
MTLRKFCVESEMSASGKATILNMPKQSIGNCDSIGPPSQDNRAIEWMWHLIWLFDLKHGFLKLVRVMPKKQRLTHLFEIIERILRDTPSSSTKTGEIPCFDPLGLSMLDHLLNTSLTHVKIFEDQVQELPEAQGAGVIDRDSVQEPPTGPSISAPHKILHRGDIHCVWLKHVSASDIGQSTVDTGLEVYSVSGHPEVGSELTPLS